MTIPPRQCKIRKVTYCRKSVLVVVGIHHFVSILPRGSFEEAAPCILFKALKNEVDYEEIKIDKRREKRNDK
jgi:hypothetical protein